MLNRSSIRAVVVAMAILVSVAQCNTGLAAFANGDVITHPQGGWGESPTAFNAAGILLANFDSIYASTGGEVEIGIRGSAGFSMSFSNPTDLLAYLPALGPIGPLTSDHSNPSSTVSGAFGGEVLALRLNIDVSDAGLTLGALGIPFGDLQLQNFIHSEINLNGLSVRQFSALVNNLLGGGSSLFFSITELNPITNDLNRSFAGGTVSAFAQDHMRVPAGIPGDYNADGVVDAADYVVWRKGLGATYTQNQYNVWRTNFGKTSGSGASLAAIPEPAASLIPIGLLGLAWRRKRRNSC